MNGLLRDLSARWWYFKQPIGASRGGLAVVACACAAVFVCFFAVGRATVPAKAPQLQPGSGLALSYSGATIPVGLGGVPSIATVDFTAKRPPLTRHAHATTVAPSSAPAAQTTSPPATITPSAPSPRPVSTPARHPRHSGGGVSFNSSG